MGAFAPLQVFHLKVLQTKDLPPKIFWLLFLTTFVTLLQTFKVIPSTRPKLLNLNQDHPSKKSGFSG